MPALPLIQITIPPFIFSLLTRICGHGTAFTYTKDFVSTYTYTQPGIYRVFVLVDDRAHGRNYHEFTIYVDDPDNPGAYSAPSGGSHPVIDITASSPRIGVAPLTVRFDASRSFDLEGDTFEVFGNFGILLLKKTKKV